MHQHLLRRSLGTQLPPTVLEGPHQFLLLRVHGDHRLSQGELQLHRPVQVLKLGVAVRVFRPRQGLAIGLQAIAHVVEQFGDHAMADLVPLALQCRRQLTHALAGPAQRDSGSPRLVGSTSRSKSSRKLGSCSTVRFRPPPGWRMRPFAAPTAGWPNSRMPRRIVPREAPVALATAAWPPRPAADASAASTSRRTRSSTTEAIAW